MDDKLKLSTPWVTLSRQFEAMFGDDPDIKVEYVDGDGEYAIKLYVEGSDKADALTELLPTEYGFGNVVVNVKVIPANKTQKKEDLYRAAFEGNPAFSYAVTADGIFTNPVTYVVFKNKVVQFWNDDLGDVNGNETTLYEDIASKLFVLDGGACFCTDTPENLGIPAK